MGVGLAVCGMSIYIPPPAFLLGPGQANVVQGRKGGVQGLLPQTGILSVTQC